MNPARTCRWCKRPTDIPALLSAINQRVPLTQLVVDWLHDEVHGCPVCMLAVLRQSGIEDYHYDMASSARIWDYQEEVERWRTAEREEAGGDW